MSYLTFNCGLDCISSRRKNDLSFATVLAFRNRDTHLWHSSPASGVPINPSVSQSSWSWFRQWHL